MKQMTKVFVVLEILLASAIDLSNAADANWRDGISQTHPRVYLNAEIITGLKKQISASSPAAQRFQEMVDSAVIGGRNVYGFRGAHAALLYQLIGTDTYAEKAIEIVEQQVAEAESKINAGQRPSVSGDQYLHAGRAIGDLACVYDWCHDRLTPDQKRRWLAYASQTVWNLWHHKEAQWGGKPHPWAGWSVNNPGNNYYYSFLTATLWLGLAAWDEDPRANEFLTFFREEKIGKELVPYFQQRLQGGGSREGTGYGVAHRSVFEILGVWKASTGEDLVRQLQHPADSVLYMIHSTVPTMDYINPVGDHARDRTGKLFDYHRSYMLRAQTLVNDPRIRETAQSWLNDCSVPRMAHGFMFADDFLCYRPELSQRPLSDLNTAYHAEGVGHILLRSSWNRDAVWAALQCGVFDESHAHQDQGAFVIYKDGWLAPDQNVYTHSGIHQATDHHNLVRFAKAGKTCKMFRPTQCKLVAFESNDDFSYLAMDLSPAFVWNYQWKREKEPLIEWTRQFLFVQPGCFIVFDRTRTDPEVETSWILNLPQKPAVDGNRATVSNDKASLTVQSLLPETCKTQIVDWTSLNSEADQARRFYTGGWRVDRVPSIRKPEQVFLHLLHVDDAVRGVEQKSAAGTHGVEISLSDGSVVSVQFNQNGAVGGAMRITKSGKSVLDRALTHTVERLPAFAEP
jgi:hypothetical protein